MLKTKCVWWWNSEIYVYRNNNSKERYVISMVYGGFENILTI